MHCTAPSDARLVYVLVARSHLLVPSQLLHENMALAVHVAREYHSEHQVLIVLGALLSFIRSELLPPHRHQFVRSTPPASSNVLCSHCRASHMHFCYTDSTSNAIECPSCYQRRSGQRVPMRVCDILGVYALQLLRGECGSNADHCKALLQVFEIVYSRGQFSLSKAALTCISSLVEREFAMNHQRNRFRTIKVPRWAAHALFPEYSCAMMIRCGDAFAAPCAAALGWWTDSNGVQCSMFEHVNSRLLKRNEFVTEAAATTDDSATIGTCSMSSFPHQGRLPFGRELSTACVTILSMMQADGAVSEADAVAALMQQGMQLESIGCSTMHMMNTSVIVAFDGKFWISSPQGPRDPCKPHSGCKSHSGSCVDLPHDCQAAVFVVLSDTNDAPLPRSSSSCVAYAVPLSHAEEALVAGVQAVLDHPSSLCSDLVHLSAALRSNHGSFTRALLALKLENVSAQGVSHAVAQHDESLCPVCLAQPVTVRNVCGHGLCPSCWTEFVANAVCNSSTPEVAKGNDDAGASRVLDIKCPADLEGKCRCAVEFSVLRKALPQGIEVLVRTAMRSMSKFFLSGASAVAQCVCGNVACGTLMDSEVECTCGHVQCIGDMKRGMARASFLPHPHLSSDEELLWLQMNTSGSEQRNMLMRYKNCPKCGTVTTKCGCQGAVVCTGMDKCPNEACDHMRCGKCGSDWCWICRRVGSTESRCSRPVSEQKDTKELLLRITPEVQAMEKSLMEMGAKSLFEDLQLTDGEAGVISKRLNRTVVSISGVEVFSVEACKQAMQLLDSQCAVIETADLAASNLPRDWLQMQQGGRKFYVNSVSKLTQWHTPHSRPSPRAKLKVELLQDPGYFSGRRLCSRHCLAPPSMSFTLVSRPVAAFGRLHSRRTRAAAREQNCECQPDRFSSRRHRVRKRAGAAEHVRCAVLQRVQCVQPHSNRAISSNHTSYHGQQQHLRHISAVSDTPFSSCIENPQSHHCHGHEGLLNWLNTCMQPS